VAQRVWSEDETLLAFRLYCTTTFGRIHTGNPDIRELASLIGRTPDAVAMKMLNLASLDPRVLERGRVGLQNASRRDVELWDKFNSRLSDLYWASGQAAKRIVKSPTTLGADVSERFREFVGPTDVIREVPVRLAQRFFRDTVLASYNNKCAISGIDRKDLLSAAHIIPWSADLDRRTDPRNGIALSALHDRAFDRGLISFSDAGQLLVSDKLKTKTPNEVIRGSILEFEGRDLIAGEKFAPDPLALAYHRERVFKAS
jgi:putative restriction endonuclease